jgi:hypothetical protein
VRTPRRAATDRCIPQRVPCTRADLRTAYATRADNPRDALRRVRPQFCPTLPPCMSYPSKESVGLSVVMVSKSAVKEDGASTTDCAQSERDQVFAPWALLRQTSSASSVN